MTYGSRNRTLSEVVVAVVFVCFMTGFVAVMCLGNYYRAKRAQERQRQRRLARLAGGSGILESPRSYRSGSSSTSQVSSGDPGSNAGEQQHLLGSIRRAAASAGSNAGSQFSSGEAQRRRNVGGDESMDLLLTESPAPRTMSV